jgi:hypothetical protein
MKYNTQSTLCHIFTALSSKPSVIYILAGVALLSIILLGYRYAKPLDDELKCRVWLGRELFPVVCQDDVLMPADRLSQISAVNLRCACSGEPFVYQPFEGPVDYDGEQQGSVVLFRIIAWCPRACHGNARVVLLENGAAHLLSEASFQRAIANGYRSENKDSSSPAHLDSGGNSRH